MNTRIIPITAFILWSIFCWRWYVCGIKQQCGDNDIAAANAIKTEPSTYPSPKDTTGSAQAQQAIESAGTTSNSAGATSNSASNPQKTLSDDISSTQIVAVEDHVLIHFPYGSTRRVDDDAIDAYLSELANALIASDGKVSLIGHTDNIGGPAFNKTMSLERARHIRATLVKKGVSAKQVIIKGMGESKPIGTNDNPRGRYKNRRVEVRISK